MLSIARKSLPLAAVLALLAGCEAEPDEGAPAADAKTELAAIARVEGTQVKAIEAHDLAGATAVYAPEANFVAPGGGILGGEMISKAFEGFLADKAFSVVLDDNSKTEWVSTSGDLAVTGWTATYTHTGADGKVTTAPMGNQTVWKKSGDGDWQIVSDINYLTGPEKPVE